MSSAKSPQEKKGLSLERDRRNTYGENNKSSRKNIPRSKQLSHMKERRVAREALGHLKGAVEENIAEAAELATRVRSKVYRRKSFRKVPDTPLGVVLERKRNTEGRS